MTQSEYESEVKFRLCKSMQSSESFSSTWASVQVETCPCII